MKVRYIQLGADRSVHVLQQHVFPNSALPPFTYLKALLIVKTPTQPQLSLTLKRNLSRKLSNLATLEMEIAQPFA